VANKQEIIADYMRQKREAEMEIFKYNAESTAMGTPAKSEMQPTAEHQNEEARVIESNIFGKKEHVRRIDKLIEDETGVVIKQEERELRNRIRSENAEWIVANPNETLVHLGASLNDSERRPIDNLIDDFYLDPDTKVSDL
jgi:hypothetical protein